MRRRVRIGGLLLVVSTFFLPLRAQDRPEPASGSGFPADYPMDRAGVFLQGAEWMVVSNQMPERTKASHGIAASLSYGVIPAKVVAEYRGEHAPTRTETAQPVLCVCHILSLPGDPALVRLHPKKGSRELDGGKMIVYPILGGSKQVDARQSDLVPVDVSQPGSGIWLVRPQSSLEPGEYALMLGTENINLFPFEVALPAAPAIGAH